MGNREQRELGEQREQRELRELGKLGEMRKLTQNSTLPVTCYTPSEAEVLPVPCSLFPDQ
jgi:serine protease inhibitor ecotin